MLMKCIAKQISISESFPGCQGYKTLYFYRNVNDSGKHPSTGAYFCDTSTWTIHEEISPDWSSEGWYRFTGPSGTQMPEKAPGKGHCGTYAPGWLNGTHPDKAGQTIPGTVCFHFSSDKCYEKVSIEITKCDQYFVYRLPETPWCQLRYCATWP